MPAEKNSQPPFKIHLPLLCLKFWEDILAGTILTSSWQPCTDNWSYPAHQTCRVLPIAFTAVTKPLTRMQHTLNSRGETETKDTKQKHQPRKQETSRDRQAETQTQARLWRSSHALSSAAAAQLCVCGAASAAPVTPVPAPHIPVQLVAPRAPPGRHTVKYFCSQPFHVAFTSDCASER